MKLTISQAILIGSQDRLTLIGKDPQGYLIISGEVTAVEYDKGVVRDSHGCHYEATWADPALDEIAIPSRFDKWKRVHRYRAKKWQLKFGWTPIVPEAAAQAEQWGIVAIGQSLHLVGLLAGHPCEPDGWGATAAISHLDLDANFAVTASHQRWHLGSPWTGKLSALLEEVIDHLRKGAPSGADVFFLDKHDLGDFEGRLHVLKS